MRNGVWGEGEGGDDISDVVGLEEEEEWDSTGAAAVAAATEGRFLLSDFADAERCCLRARF